MLRMRLEFEEIRLSNSAVRRSDGRPRGALAEERLGRF